MKNPHLTLFCFIFSCCSLFLQAQSTAFDISGTVKTVDKKDDREIERGRGDVEIEEDVKILEINLRRTNPTVSGDVTVRWAVMMKDRRGNLQAISKGEQHIKVEVGIPTKLESDSFSVKTANFDFKNGRDNKIEQEVEGYAIMIFDQEGNELGAKFQPKSLEEGVRAGLLKGIPKEEDVTRVPKGRKAPK